jgi:FAD-dependent oxidoreductase domain-containing protein 1
VSTADIVIVGGGGIGCASAYFITKFAPSLRVVVCERDPSYARAATALAAGGVRQQFSTPENVLMSRFGVEFLQHAGGELAVGADAPDLGYVPGRYLRLAPEAAADEARAQAQMQRSLGAAPETLERDGLARRFPWMNLEDVGVGILGGGGEGVFDPYALLQALRRKSIEQGATFLAAEAVGFELDASGRVAGVRLADGELIACGAVVNAAGAQAGHVAALAGLELPVKPLKAHTFAFMAQDPPDNCPIVLDHVQRLNFKPDGRLFLASAPRGDERDEMADHVVDHGLFEEVVWPALAHRARQFQALKLVRAWVGHIEWNSFDANPVLGPHPERDNFHFAAGFSGHGAQHIPAAGRAIAELLVFGAYRTLDLSRLGYARIAAGAPLRELA